MCWTPVIRCYKALSRRRINCKRRCLSRTDDVWGQNSGGPGCCSYLEHTSSADCALSFLSNSLPVSAFLFRHSISFQPFGFGLKANPVLLVFDLYSKSVAI